VHDVLIWQKGSRYVFRIRTSPSMMVSMLVGHAGALPHKRWTIVAPSYEGGKRIAALFKQALAERRPAVAFAPESYFTLGTMGRGRGRRRCRDAARGDLQHRLWLGPLAVRGRRQHLRTVSELRGG
jgi:hypothetical protein